MSATNMVANGKEKLLSVNDRLEEALSGGQRQESGKHQFDPRLNNELLIWILGGPSNDAPARELLLSMIEDYPGRVPLTAIRDQVKQEFLRLGFNPGGNSYRISEYIEDGNRHKWHECFDWTGDVPVEKTQLSDQAQRLLSLIDDSLSSEIMFTLFQHTTRTLEGLGVGWATFKASDDIDASVVNAVDTLIRQLGIRRRYPGQAHFFGAEQIPATGITLPRMFREFLGSANISADQVVDELRSSRVGVLNQGTLGISPRELYITRGHQRNEHGQNIGWRCPKCAAFYLHPTGITSVCPDCVEVELEQGVPGDSFDYYSYLAEDSGPEFRLRCEELTGQTDDFDRHQRQRWFQEVFIGDEGNTKLVNGVDLLSVTTTMEAGVDIGGLEAVMMANMPPRRFNYQQRVGRAGRRGAGVSLAVTFCRGRSHDDYYYQLPEEITGSPPPPPYVDVGSEAILRRVFVKELLRTAFERMELAEDRMLRDSVHGEFGPVADWHLRLQTLREWVDSAESTVAARMILDSLRVGTKWAGNVVSCSAKRWCHTPRVECWRRYPRLCTVR